LFEKHLYVRGMGAQERTRDYIAIPKGPGFVYAYENQLYNRVKTEGRTKYLKCSRVFNWTKPVHFCGPTLESTIRGEGRCPVFIKHDGTDGTDRTDGTMTGVRSAILAVPVTPI